jgi:hypothetical protein
MEAKQAAETEPTYPNPKMLTDKLKCILLASEYFVGYGSVLRTIAIMSR